MTAVERFRSFAPHILGITRIVLGIMFAAHGAQKVLGMFGGLPPGADGWQVVVSGWIELVGGLLLTVGLLSRATAFLCSGLMAFAYFMGHASGGFLPTMNGGELAVMYCWFFLYLSAQGPGAFAIDNLIARRAR